MELYAARFACTILSLSLISSIATTLWLGNRTNSSNHNNYGNSNNNNNNTNTNTATGPTMSGILIASYAVQFIALSTNGVHGSGYPVPVIDDPIMGTRVFILRWCEWTPLAFTMTFLIAGVEPGVPLKDAYALGATQGLSTLCGLILPYCWTALQWWIIMIISFILYFVMFPVLAAKKRKFLSQEPGKTAHSKELYNRTRLSYRLMQTCTAAWTALVTMYCLAGAAVYYTPAEQKQQGNDEDLWLIQRPYFTMLWESTMDVILKNLYMNIIVQVHKVAFDDGERAQRRLEELRQLLNAVWENSSDVVCISVQGKNGTVSTMVSPVYMRLFQNVKERPKAIVFEMKNEDLARGPEKVTATVVDDFDREALHRSETESRSTNTHSLSQIVDNVDLSSNKKAIDERLLHSLAGMIATAWTAGDLQTSLTHSLLKRSDDSSNNHGEEGAGGPVGPPLVVEESTPCEANIRWLENEAMFMLIRDISAQSRRFEAERTMIMQTTARKKDAEANRFTRHEVKNGLLAAIHLCESLAGTEELAMDSPHSTGGGGSSPAPDRAVAARSESSRSRVTAHALELDKELKNILQTVLSDAMARDLIHGVYEPKLGPVQITELFVPTSERFQVIASPNPLPLIYSDPQLLLYIHRNAMSNACKYGAIDGTVTTRLHYDENKEMLRMDVENLPGPDHDRLLSFGAQACEMVFEPGKRLHVEDAVGMLHQPSRIHSAGDGAWIIRKCAETLKGNANIVFGKDKTTFSFTCPAKPYDKGVSEAQMFQIPENSWGIAIDDSKIQRKLLNNLLETAGVSESRRVIQGSSTAEILNFDSYLVDMLRQYPTDRFLVIVDENLDVRQNGFTTNVSGSECIRKVRQRLLPDQEDRLLALVRSANDSVEDVQIYSARAHGCIPKATSLPASFVQTIGFFWKQRFKGVAPSESKAQTSDGSDDDYNDDFASMVVEELNLNIAYIDKLCAPPLTRSTMEKSWRQIWERLHSLKGDLSSLLETPLIYKTVKDINAMRGPHLPEEFESKWAMLRSQLMDIVGAIGSNVTMDTAGDTGSSSRGTKRRNPGGDPVLDENGIEDGHKKLRALVREPNGKYA
eukprot:scaffold586_cov68-Cylindrotheca_fusiformis.AAC.10